MGEFNPIERNYVYQLGKELNIDKMNEALEYIKGEHDFDLLSSNEHKEKNTIRTIYSAKISKKDDIITISLVSNGFLKYMVRTIVGILVQITWIILLIIIGKSLLHKASKRIVVQGG